MKKWYTKALMSILFGSAIAACSDMNDLHDKYLEGGETIYLAKFDSVSLHPGRERLMIEYWLSDPKAKKCEIKWNLGESSTVVDISQSEGDTPNVLYLSELKEGSTSFDFVVYTEDMKYPSLKMNYTTTIYGDKYQSTLMNATAVSPEYNMPDKEFVFKWSSNYEGVVAYKLKYVTRTGETKNLRLEPTDEKTVVLADFPEDGSFEYSTVYCPTTLTIDEFETPTHTRTFDIGGDAAYELKASMQANASLGSDWSVINDYMKSLGWEYTEHPNNADGKDHEGVSHCKVVNDKTLGQYVFQFDIHAKAKSDKTIDILDGDRGELIDRQRNEMKTQTKADCYHMNGNWDEWQTLEWKFKIPKGFRPTKDFTHIHQLKAQEGNNGSPIITITPRADDAKSKNARIQVIHTGESSSRGTIIDNLPIKDFEDQWIQVTTKMHYTHNGYFYIKMVRISDGKVLVDKAFYDMDMWRKDAINIRSKFGIYRSFGTTIDSKKTFPTNGIKDEKLYLGDFKIYEKKTNTDPQPHE